MFDLLKFCIGTCNLKKQYISVRQGVLDSNPNGNHNYSVLYCNYLFKIWF